MVVAISLCFFDPVSQSITHISQSLLYMYRNISYTFYTYKSSSNFC